MTKARLGWMAVAGYHGDKATFTRLYVGSRISLADALEAFRSGESARAAGAPCGCAECAEAD